MSMTVSDDGQPAEIRTLDSFELPQIDFLKIDVEGYEYFVLNGGIKTLLRTKPTIIVEDKGCEAVYGLAPHAAITFLEGLGASVFYEMNGDIIMGWLD